MLKTSRSFNARALAAMAALALMAGCGGGCGNCTVPAFHTLPTGVTPPPADATPTPNPGVTPTPIAALSCAQNAISGQGVPLGTDATFAVLASSTVTNSGLTIVTGDLGVSPGTAVTGFGAGAGTVTGGSIHADDSTAAQAQLDLTYQPGGCACRHWRNDDCAGRLQSARVAGDHRERHTGRAQQSQQRLHFPDGIDAHDVGQ